jgi:hypothetical protein
MGSYTPASCSENARFDSGLGDHYPKSFRGFVQFVYAASEKIL